MAMKHGLWSLLLKEEQTLRECEDRMLRIFGHNREEDREGNIKRSFMMCTLHKILFG
jgi:hypothetical protein